jgi:hypothetical protein
MSGIGNNSELVVFAGTVIPALFLVFRFLLKLQISGEDIYEKSQNFQSETIVEQYKIIRDLKALKDACEKRDEGARELIDSLTKELAELKAQVIQLELKATE